MLKQYECAFGYIDPGSDIGQIREKLSNKDLKQEKEMSPRKVTSEQWLNIEKLAAYCIYDLVLVELRDRIADAEQRIGELEGNHLAKPDSSSAPTDGLVQRVAASMADSDPGYSKEARAAIMAVADWLAEGKGWSGPWERAAGDLRREAERYG